MAKAKQIQKKSKCMFTNALKIAQVAGVSDPTPLNWFKAGKLPGVQIGNVVRFPIAEVAAILGISPEALLPSEE
jgi:excisionase family DNA binding protein